MKVNFPIEIMEDITGTVSLTIKIGSEMRSHALRKGISPDEIEEAVAQKMAEIARDVADLLKVAYVEDE